MTPRALFGTLYLQLLMSLTSAQCQDKQCSVCSVVADRLINFVTAEAQQLSSCSYILISSAPIDQLQVKVVLKPRRNSNVRFVDEVKVIYGEVFIILRGGRALIARGDVGSELSSGSVEVTSGLTMSRDDRFTTIELQAGHYGLTLKYNGVSTLLRLTGPKGQDLAADGLCKAKAVLTDFQEECETEYEDRTEPQFDADSLCAPLDSFSSSLAVQMKSLCRSVLKFTGDSDQLPCSMFLAFNTISDLKDQNNDLVVLSCNLELLKSCLSKVCGSEEFCGAAEAGSTDSACFCHASVAASYRHTGQVGALQCVVSDATLSIPACFLKEKGVDYTQLHLEDDGCKGSLDQDSQLVVFQTNKDQMCGAMLKTSDGSMKYINSVFGPDGATVADMSCPFAVPEISVDFDVSVTVLEDPDSPGPVKYTSTTLGTYTVLMKAFLDAEHLQVIDAQMRLRLNTPVYFQIQVQGLDHLSPALVLDSCWATNQHAPDQDPKYYLIKDRCPSDPSVALLHSGVGTDVELMFRMFQFVGHDSDIYLHCVMKLCLPQEDCTLECGESSRRRRSSAPPYAASFSVNALNWK